MRGRHTRRESLSRLSSAGDGAGKGMSRNQSFDLVRIFAFIGIVFLHMGVTVDTATTPLAAAINAAVRFAVPFFFAISGFYLAYADVRKAGKGLRKELAFTVFAVALYFALAFVGAWDWSNIGLPISAFFETDWIGPFVMWNDFPFAYHLWFLFAALYVYVILAVLGLFGISRTAFLVVGFILLAARFVLTEFTGEIPPLGMIPRSFLLFALPCFALGMAFRFLESHLEKIPAPLSTVLIVFGAAVAYGESLCFGLQELYLGSIITVVGLFSLCLRCPHPFSHTTIAQGIGMLTCFGGAPMGVAYVVHLAILQAIMDAWRVDPLVANLPITIEVWFSCVVVSLAVGYICAFILGLPRRISKSSSQPRHARQ